jgi:phosphomethylpyrimidine synthase
MELTQQVRDYARDRGMSDADAVQSGMQEKSEEFRKKKEIYVAKPI